MTRQAIPIPHSAGVLLAALMIASTTVADPPKAEDKNEKGALADEQHRRDAEQVVGAIEIERLDGEKWVKAKRLEKPLLYYGDATRKNDRGSVWAWGDKGRPVAVLELYRGANEQNKWACAICNT